MMPTSTTPALASFRSLLARACCRRAALPPFLPLPPFPPFGPFVLFGDFVPLPFPPFVLFGDFVPLPSPFFELPFLPSPPPCSFFSEQAESARISSTKSSNGLVVEVGNLAV